MHADPIEMGLGNTPKELSVGSKADLLLAETDRRTVNVTPP